MNLVATSLLNAFSHVSHRLTNGVMHPVLRRMQPQAVLRIENLPPDRKLIALTIDDAPSRQTHRLLDLLAGHAATATFFIHGDGIRGPAEASLIQRMLAEGHEVANHMPESIPSMQLPPDRFAAEFTRNHRILEDHGVTPRRFRPSHGFYNRSMAGFLLGKGVELGYRPTFYLGLNFPWDVFFPIPRAYGFHNACAARPGRIVVFHDNQDRKNLRGGIIDQTGRTLTALPLFFAKLADQGFGSRSIANLEAL